MYTAPSNPSSTISAGMVVTLRVQILYLGYPSGYPSGHKDLGHPRRMDKLPPGGPYSVPSSHGSPHNQKQDPWGKLRHSWRGGPFQPHLHSCQEAGPISEVRAYRLSAQCGVLKNVGHFQRLGNSRPAACMYFWVPIPGKLHFCYVPLGGAQ